MTKFTKLAAVAVLAIAPAVSAYASPVTGVINIGGRDTFTDSAITFNPTTGLVNFATGTMASFDPLTSGNFAGATVANLTSFTFSAASGVTVFSVTNNLSQSLSFTISNLLTKTIGTDSNGQTLSLSGTGIFKETGYDNTFGTFSLTSSSSGQVYGFQIISSAAVTPEPSSLMLLGTGLIGAATTMVRRRRAVTA